MLTKSTIRGFFSGIALALASACAIVSCAPAHAQIINPNPPAGGIFTVANVAALRALNCFSGVMYQDQGYYTIGDRGDGRYICDASDTTTPDNGGTVLAAANTFRLKLQFAGRFTSRQFGAKGDNTTDDTTALQNFVTASRAQSGNSIEGKWDKGTYKVTGTLTVGTNQFLTFDPGVIINYSPADPANNPLFQMAGQTGVYMYGNGATLNGSQATVSSSATGSAFFIYGTQQFKISGFNINGFAVDGVTVTGDNSGSGPCVNGILENLVVNGSARNGLSIISARNLTVTGGQYSTSTGSPSGPFAGIDIEPNGNSFIENVNVNGVATSGNKGSGIQITPAAMNNGANRMSVVITGGRSLNDGGVVGAPTVSQPALYFVNGGAPTNIVYGSIIVNGYTIESPQGAGVGFSNWDGAFMPPVTIDNTTVINPDYLLSAPNNYDRAGFVVYTKTAQAVTSQGNIVIRNSTARDTRGTARMTWGFALFVDAAKTLNNIQVINPTSINYTASEKTDVSTQCATVTGGCTLVDVQYTIPSPVTVTGSASMADYGGKRITLGTTSMAPVLPLAANSMGMHFEFQNGTGINSTAVTPASGDTIQWYGWGTTAPVILDAGGYVSLRSFGGTSWVIETASGQLRRATTLKQGSIQFSSAAPAGGSIGAIGDISFNTAPAVGQPRGWQCSAGTATTCTTWISMGNN